MSDRSVGVGPVCRRIVVRGVVQGVGFRPHVLRVAESVDVAGWCRNDATCVLIEVEGTLDRVTEFERRLESDAPPLARILSVETTKQPPVGHIGFRIAASASTAGARTMVPPDTAVCDDCLAELHDPANRRFRHPFITCTNCGPRFTITRDLPYDRAATTMADFPMCPACAEEYADPHDRRHHAQPIACHDCGPNLRVTGPSGAHIASGTEASLREAVAALHAGAIVAIKGIGGYHLACDAASQAATTALRTRKQRPDQPFAVMVRDLATARRFVEVDTAEAVLTSAARPIVLLPRVAGASVAHGIAPGLDELGVVLPYAPLHHLLFANLPDGSPGAPDALVMTSGNLSGEPLCFDDADALARLGRIADLFLSHDRAIAVPCDDSVIAWDDGDVLPLRRSRGYAPLPVAMAEVSRVVLAAGADVKNTFALARDGQAFVSAHLGDLETLESRSAYERATAQLLGFHRSSPDLVVADLHPRYASRAWARSLADGLGVPLHSVQHHHAHLASLAAEHGRLDEPLLGLVYDGTGYGCDAEVWGGELILLGDGGRTATRLGHLGNVRLPGGDAGVRNPVRTAALAMLVAGVELTGTPVDQALTASERRFIEACARTATGWVATSSVGRLFDVVSALLGTCGRATYEAQAAIELEAAARCWSQDQGTAAVPLPLPLSIVEGVAILDPDPLVAALADAVRAGTPTGHLAWSFHVALASASAVLAGDLAQRLGLATVGLTGGVFGNRLLLRLLRSGLADAGLEVLTHRLVPANDGGLSLGQVAIGVRVLEETGPRQARPTMDV